jgi:hypothetical protein
MEKRQPGPTQADLNRDPNSVYIDDEGYTDAEIARSTELVTQQGILLRTLEGDLPTQRQESEA